MVVALASSEVAVAIAEASLSMLVLATSISLACSPIFASSFFDCFSAVVMAFWVFFATSSHHSKYSLGALTL